MNLLTYFKDEQVCLSYLETIRWEGRLACPYSDCGKDKIFRCKDHKYKCAECKRIYSVKVGVQEIITKWKLSKQLLASKLGMLKGTFQNKLNPEHPTQFTEDEMTLLRCALLELKHDLSSIDEIDFETAMRLISQKKV